MKKEWCIPPKKNAEFVCAMESVLELYHKPYDRLEFHSTPKHGSWLNVAEIELGILSRQCMGRRIADASTLIREIEQWQTDRNHRASKVRWQFTTKDARITPRKLYPTI